MAGEPATAQSILDHIPPGGVLKAIWSVIAGAFVMVGTLLWYFARRDRKSIDDRLDKHDDSLVRVHKRVDEVCDELREIPDKYVAIYACRDRHEDLLRSYNRQIEESIHIRGLLEQHILKGGAAS